MIRSITIGTPVFSKSRAALADDLLNFQAQAQGLSQRHGLEARTIRLTLPPPAGAAAYQEAGTLRSIVDTTRALADAAGARWYCLPLDLTDGNEHDALLNEAQALVVKDSRLFLNLIVATPEQISMTGARMAGSFILSLARRSQNGIDNFRVGVSAACPAATPFFPFSRHEGDQPAFSLAMETAQTALVCARAAREQNWGLVQFQESLISELQAAMSRVDGFGRELEQATGVRYCGLDGSLAPFPDGDTSVATLVELLGPSPAGAHGSVFVTSILSEAIRQAGERAEARMVGFNGVMYSVLEDNGLTRANNLRAISLNKLALLSTVCGCGIDMVPVPSTMFQEDMTGLILDIATLAVRLKKPLGVRLLPIPNRAINEFTNLNLDFLCDSRVMDPGVSASIPLLHDDVWRYAAQRTKGTTT